MAAFFRVLRNFFGRGNPKKQNVKASPFRRKSLRLKGFSVDLWQLFSAFCAIFSAEETFNKPDPWRYFCVKRRVTQ